MVQRNDLFARQGIISVAARTSGDIDSKRYDKHGE